MRAASGGGESPRRRYAVRLPQPRRPGAALDELARCRDLDQQASRWRDSAPSVRRGRSARTRERAVEDQRRARSLFADRQHVSLDDPAPSAAGDGLVNGDAPEGVAQVGGEIGERARGAGEEDDSALPIDRPRNQPEGKTQRRPDRYVVAVSEGGQRDRPLVLDNSQLESAVGGGRRAQCGRSAPPACRSDLDHLGRCSP